MKKLFALAIIGLLLIPSLAQAGAVTPTTRSSAQGIFKIFHFAQVQSGDTYTGPASVKAFWIQPVDAAASYGSVAKSSTTYTFTLGGASDVAELYLFIVE